jgi:hypothetical protein
LNLTPAPRSRSIFRGHSRLGIGEGPGRPVVDGEQYLAADPPLERDAELLHGLRPWMTLDAEPADHRLAGGGVEAWSSLSVGGWAAVVRLVPAGDFDRRAAYFAHAHLRAEDEVTSATDPGLLLGHGDAFDPPWRDGQRVVATAVPPAALVRPEQVAAEAGAATRLLAALYCALATQRRLLIGVPTAELVPGHPLAALLSFARAALPTPLRRRVKLRCFTRQPSAFLRLGANVLVVPEELAGQALGLDRDALLLDRDAVLLAGPPLPPQALAFAEPVIQLAIERPAAWLGFVERSVPPVPDLPTPEQVASLRVASLFARHASDDDSGLDRAVAEIDGQMASDPSTIGGALAASGWWPWWRRRSRLAPSRLREAALGWLVASCWSDSRPPEATLETWEQVCADLRLGGLRHAEVAALWQGGRRRWPLIPPFEPRQLEALAGLAADRAVRAQLVATAAADSTLAGCCGSPLAEHLRDSFGEVPRPEPPLPPPGFDVGPPANELPSVSWEPAIFAVLRSVSSGERSPARHDVEWWSTLLADAYPFTVSDAEERSPERARASCALLWRARRFLGAEERAALAATLENPRSRGAALLSPCSSEAMSMQERVTLFYRRHGAAPEPRLLRATVDGRPGHALLWHCRAAAGGAKGKRAKGQKDQRALAPSVEELERELSAAGGGLLLAGSLDPATDGSLRIAVIAAPGWQPAQQLLSIRPGRPPAARPLADCLLALDPGEHLIVPVDRAAEEQLGVLREGLGCLPREISALVFETIAQPSLDYRLSVLEDRAGRVPPLAASDDAVDAARPAPRWRRWLGKPMRKGALAAALVLGLGAGFALATWSARSQGTLRISAQRVEAIERALARVERKLAALPTANARRGAGAPASGGGPGKPAGRGR